MVRKANILSPHTHRVARDRRGCAGHARIRKRADHRRLFPVSTDESCSGSRPARSAHRGDAIIGRRSAVAMDGSTAISQEAFFRMLARLTPTRDRRSMPWMRSRGGRASISPVRPPRRSVPRALRARADPIKLAALQEVMRREFRWQHLPSCPPGLPLYLLQEGTVGRSRHRLLRPAHRR